MTLKPILEFVVRIGALFMWARAGGALFPPINLKSPP